MTPPQAAAEGPRDLLLQAPQAAGNRTRLAAGGIERAFDFRFFCSNQFWAYFKVSENVSPDTSFDRIIEIVDEIGNADSSVIMLALSTKGMLVLDDKLARQEARSLGVRITGTLGILKYATEVNWISEKTVFEVCEKMRKQGFRIPPIKDHLSFDQYLKSLGE